MIFDGEMRTASADVIPIVIIDVIISYHAHTNSDSDRHTYTHTDRHIPMTHGDKPNNIS